MQHFFIPTKSGPTAHMPRQFIGETKVETIRQNHQAALVIAPLLRLTNVTCWQVLKHLWQSYDCHVIASRQTTAGTL
eukprot:8906636-Ditylum_brightwellii.AAC.2